MSSDHDNTIALTGLQALAPIMIFTSHWTEGLFKDPFTQGQLSIDFFFAIEGYFCGRLMAEGGRTATFQSLIWGRLSRIYPLYLLGILMSLSVAAILAEVGSVEWPWPVVQQAVTFNPFFLPTFVDPAYVFPLNPPTWAIALEVYAFAMLCLLRKWLNLHLLIPLVLSAGLLCLAVAFLARNPNMGYQPQSYWGGYPRCLFGFFYGALAYHLVQRWGHKLPRLNPLLMWCAFLAMMLLPSKYVSLPLLVVAMPIVVLLSATATNPLWLRGVARQAGRLAYGFYMLSYPVLIALRHGVEAIGRPQSALGFLFFYIVVLGSIAVVSHVAVAALRSKGEATKAAA
ncbi:acyltransferase [Rhizobium sp. P32RR-XVIII]|uniref:acyltransferase family protein n=1 Tax=Rhizobium sp. P32RR-XVIII TaxID=2726738 RepID=UPI0014576E0A|nr:acyltransferase [Rhizobium sp. P32RR-XVIII]